jgi:CRP/FNR family transcriptional regulator, nitrogen oxide reductase regulator
MDGWSAVRFAPLFSGVLPEDYRRICAVARVQKFARRETLYLEGDAAEQVFLLISGFVKTTKLGPRGAEVILRVGVPGDVLGAMSLCPTGRHTTTAQALRMGYALVRGARVFEFLVEPLPVVHRNMIRLTGEHLEELERRFGELATKRVAPRLARQLIRLQEQIGGPINGPVEIRLSRGELAQMTGTTLFTISRRLGVWEARGLVNLRRDSVTVCDLESLRKISEES